jgi:transposase
VPKSLAAIPPRQALRRLVKRSGRKKVAERLGVEEKQIATWLRAGVPQENVRDLRELQKRPPKRLAGAEARRQEPSAFAGLSPRQALEELVRRSTREEVAERLGVSPATLDRWLRAQVPEARQHAVSALAGRSEAGRRSAETKRIRAHVLHLARTSPAVETFGITGVFQDKETGVVFGQNANGDVVTTYTIRNRKTGERRVYWTTTDNALALRAAIANEEGGYEDLFDDDNIDVEFDDF